MDGVLFSLQFSIKEFSFPTASPAGDYMLFQRQLGNSSRRVVVGMDSDRIPMDSNLAVTFHPNLF
jgi:hypothetical protein